MHKKKKASSIISKEGTSDKIKTTIIHENDIQYLECDWSPKLIVTVSNSNETKNKIHKLATPYIAKILKKV
jgi:hypothetical protein